MRASAASPLTLISFCAVFSIVPDPTAALEFILVESVETGGIHEAAPRSWCFSEAEDLYLVAFEDGAVLEVTALLEVVREVLPPSRTTPGYHGLAYIPPFRLLASFAKGGNSGPDFYRLSGEYVGGQVMGSFGEFHGLFYAQGDDGGRIHAIYGATPIEVWTLRLGFDRIIQTPLELRPRVYATGINGFTGIAYLSEPDVHLLSLETGEVFAIGRGKPFTVNGEPVGQQWLGELLAEADLKPRGVQAIDDITWDPLQERLYVVDSVQKKVFMFEIGGGVPRFHRGDPDGSGAANVADAVLVLNHLFLGGPGLACLESADVNNDGLLDLSDPIYLLHYLFLGGAPPPQPGPPGGPCGPESGFWDAQLGLGCDSYPPCAG
jgi:hypothetical protein